MKTDLQIAQENNMENIRSIAEKAQIEDVYLEQYGSTKAKINLSIMDSLKQKQDGKLILVTAINPTSAGEGKSTTTIGLVDGFQRLGVSVMGCLREPSLGPVFGLKGGATGGGYAQIVPMEEINLHFTGDMHAITTANNLVAAVLDNSMYQGNPLRIDPQKVVWKRCLDMNDRSLREITIGQNKQVNGVERPDGFMITVATEIMAILCLSNDLRDFEEKVKKCVVAYTYDNQPVTVEDLKVQGALAVVMKEAIKPNLVQTLEHTPVLVHGGPFANIAHGCNSIIATKMALKLADVVVTEAGFGADLGAEKFLDIKCRIGNLTPAAVVLVATIRALKMHGGVKKHQFAEENVEALLRGAENLQKHCESLAAFGVPFVIAINKFAQDSQNEIQALTDWCHEHGYAVELSDAWAKGSAGTVDLAKAVLHACKQENHFAPIYDETASIEEKIKAVATTVYGAKEVEYSEQAQQQLKTMKQYGWDCMPICMAKTPLSLSDDAKKIGRPRDFVLHVTEMRVSAGAGFVVVLTGNVMTMPGLPQQPAAIKMGLDEEGKIFGLF